MKHPLKAQMRLLQPLSLLAALVLLSVSGNAVAGELSPSLRAHLKKATLSPRAEDAPALWVQTLLADSGTPRGSAIPWSTLQKKLKDSPDQVQISRVESAAQLADAFTTLRDARILQDQTRKTQRRLTWFYPDDGCYARAESGVRHLKERKKGLPSKIFAFGSLKVKTSHHPSGVVGWWYHVAPTVMLADQPYVLDPAIDPSAPMTVEKWLAAVSPYPDDVEVAFCSSLTYGPYHSCGLTTAAEPISTGELEMDHSSLLDSEWSRVQELGWDPADVLGDESPFNRPESAFRKIAKP